MRVRFFESVDAAIKGLRKLDKEYTIVDHRLKRGEKIDPDVHDVTEYIIFDKGEGVCGKVQLGKKKWYILLFNDKATVVTIPAGKQHSFHALLKDISYTVLRKGPAK